MARDRLPARSSPSSAIRAAVQPSSLPARAPLGSISSSRQRNHASARHFAFRDPLATEAGRAPQAGDIRAYAAGECDLCHRDKKFRSYAAPDDSLPMSERLAASWSLGSDMTLTRLAARSVVSRSVDRSLRQMVKGLKSSIPPPRSGGGCKDGSKKSPADEGRARERGARLALNHRDHVG